MLLFFARTSYWRPWAVLLMAVGLCLASLLYAYQRLEVHSDLASLLAPSDRYRSLEKAAQDEFPGQDLVVVVANGTAAQREEFIDQLSQRLKASPGLYQDVFARMDLNFFRQRMLYYLPETDLRAVAASLQPVVKWLAQPGLSTGGPQTQALPTSQAVLNVLDQMAQDFQQTLDSRGEREYVSLWKPAVLERAPTAQLKQRLQQLLGPDQYLYNAWPGSQIHVMLVRPTESVRPALINLEQEIARLTTGYSVLEVGVTGEPAIAINEIDEAVSAAQRAALVSCMALAFLFRISFANSWRPWIMTGSLLLGLGWTVGFATLAIGSLNLLSLTACPVLIVLGAGFGIQILYSYEDQRARVAHPLPAMEVCMLQAGMHTLAAALLSAAFLGALALTGYPSLIEFAILGSTGVLLCFLSMITVLPAWLFLQERYGKRTRYRAHWTRWLKSHEALWLDRPRLTVALSVIATVVSLVLARPMHFDHNLLHLGAQGLPLSKVENRLLARQQDVLPAQYMASSLEDARRKSEQFSRLSSVARVDSPVALLPLDPERKSASVRRIANLASRLRLPATPAVRAATLKNSLRQVKARLLSLRQPVARRLLGVLEHAERVAVLSGPGPVVDSVNLYTANVRADLQEGLWLLQQQIPTPVTLNQLPGPLRLRSLGHTGKIMVQIYAKNSPWDYKARQQFWSQLQTVDRDVTGLPVVLQHQTWVLMDAFERSTWVAWVAGGAIVLLLMVYFDSLWKSLLVIMPQVLGLVWLCGAMALCGMSFNPVNIVALPMLLTVGGVLGLHIMQRLTHDPHGDILRHPIGAAMAVSGLTSLAVFASLLSARHNGIASLGFVLAVGVAANLVSTLVTMPAFMRLLAHKNENP